MALVRVQKTTIRIATTTLINNSTSKAPPASRNTPSIRPKRLVVKVEGGEFIVDQPAAMPARHFELAFQLRVRHHRWGQGDLNPHSLAACRF